MKNILFCGDIFLGGDLVEHLKKDNFSPLPKECENLIFNLENPISNDEVQVEKCTLHSPHSTLRFFDKVNTLGVNLANNHIQDKGPEGIVNTFENLKNKNIEYFGAGINAIEAGGAFRINDSLYMFGYCEQNNDYLKQIEVANNKKSGVNLFSFSNLENQLAEIPERAKAIIYLHWGREHVRLPPYHIIETAKKILSHEKVKMVIGMHPHVMQGRIKYNNKFAYLSLGNLLFPNFHMKPPCEISYNIVDNNSLYTNKRYFKVYKPTYKVWKIINRVSLAVEYSKEHNSIKHKYFIQNRRIPKVRPLKGLLLVYYRCLFLFLSCLYTMPKGLYLLFEKMNKTWVYSKIKIYRLFFYINQIGISKTLKLIRNAK
jgi:poly-gamma-glutamate synthesis protein (capsule biosynthesis protein)